MIDAMFNNGAMPSLERLAQFTEQRHQLILHNIANFSTPRYKPRDLSVDSFQETLGRAIDRRRKQSGGDPIGKLEIEDTRQLRFTPDRLEVNPRETAENVLFHDQNNRNLERTMQGLAENAMMHNAALEMLRNQFRMLETAIRGQV